MESNKLNAPYKKSQWLIPYSVNRVPRINSHNLLYIDFIKLLNEWTERFLIENYTALSSRCQNNPTSTLFGHAPAIFHLFTLKPFSIESKVKRIAIFFLNFR